MDDPKNRAKLYKAPIFLACSVIRSPDTGDFILEQIKARSLLNKVASFERATPADLNVILNHAIKLAHNRSEDLAEVGSHFYARMMKKISREQHRLQKISAKDPSSDVFSEYLRKVYTFGCW